MLKVTLSKVSWLLEVKGYKITNEEKDMIKEYYKEITKQKFKLRQAKTLIHFGLKKSEVVAGRKTFMQKFDSQYRCSGK